MIFRLGNALQTAEQNVLLQALSKTAATVAPKPVLLPVPGVLALAKVVPQALPNLKTVVTVELNLEPVNQVVPGVPGDTVFTKVVPRVLPNLKTVVIAEPNPEPVNQVVLGVPGVIVLEKEIVLQALPKTAATVAPKPVLLPVPGILVLVKESAPLAQLDLVRTAVHILIVAVVNV